jgi:hypothetical protein
MISNFIAVFYKASRQVPYKKGFVLRYNFIIPYIPLLH